MDQVRSGLGWIKIVAVAGMVVSVALGVAFFGEALSLESLAEKEAALRQYQTNHPLLVYGLAFAIYVAVTGVSLPGAAGLTLVMAWFFGLWRAALLVSFASTAGATIAFLISRYLFRETIRGRFGKHLKKFDEALSREGAFYLFTLRLIPMVPFFVINLVMGLTPIRVSTFWWVSQAGMLPGTLVYVYAGSRVPTLAALAEKGPAGVLSPQLLVAFALLGLFPILVKKCMVRVQAARVSRGAGEH